MKRYSLIFLVIAPVLTGLVVPNARGLASTNQQQKKWVIRQVEASSVVHIFIDNSLGSSLHILEAGVKEIPGDGFLTLVGEPPRHFIMSSFPEVTLLNGYSKTIKSFAIILQTAIDKPKSGYILWKRNRSASPGATCKVGSSEWPEAERVSIQKGGRFVNVLRQPGIDSARSWIPGAASDLRITVGFIEFEDGTRWKIPSGSNW